MTLATYITVFRLLLVPVFAYFVVGYSETVQCDAAQEWIRWTALTVFIIASVSDAVDGWIARKFHQYSSLGAFLDPLADKILLLTAVISLTLCRWGQGEWSLPLWFCGVVILRDVLITLFLIWLKAKRCKINFVPHWTGKVCTVTQMFAIGWVMLKFVPFSPVYPCAISALFVLWSGAMYYTQAMNLYGKSQNEIKR